MQNNVIRYILILSILIFGTNAFCANEYSNELLKVDVDQTTDNTVRVNIYTDKPYKDKIIVNKRPDNKYVILLPETSNSVTSKPDISGSTVLNDVDVKTQQYSSLPGKGYTKITIDGKKPIEVVPQAFTSKKVTSQKKSSNRPYLTPQQVQTAVPQRILDQQKPVTNNDFIPSYERQRQLNQQQNYVLPTQQSQSSNYVRREPVATQYSQTRTPAVSVMPQNTQQTTTVPQSLPVTVEETYPTNNRSNVNVNTNANTGDTSQNTEEVKEEVTEDANNKQAIDDAGQTNEEINEDELEIFKKFLKFKQKVKRKIKKLLSIRISFSSLMTVLQLILLAILVKFIRDLVIKTEKQNETKPATKRLLLDEDETFEQTYPSYSNMDVYNTNRGSFEEDNKEGFNISPISAPSNFTSKSAFQNNTNSSNNFYRPLKELNEEERMSIFDENSKDIEKSIFKNPLTKISKQDEETLFDEIEPEQENSPFTEEAYTDKREDFFNYTNSSGNNDEDFFIFEDEEDAEDVEYQEDYVDDEEEYDEEYEYEDEEDYEYVDENDEEIYNNDNASEQEIVETKPETSDPFEHLTVQAKYVIDAQRGFAQVNVDGINALIGYVGSKISVIRKFKEDIKGKMQVRLNEQPDPETMIYIIKIGSYKTLVEVKPQSIRQLLDL